MASTMNLERATALEFRSLKDLEGYRVMATDGEIGKVDDFYFDDLTWTLRYFVVDTGSWLSKRRVLVAPEAFTDSCGTDRTITTTLTREQIENAPAADLAKPVSRHYETKLRAYHAWPAYWTHAPRRERDPENPHLRSFSEVTGYGIRARDGDIGHVEDLVVEERSWIVRYLVIDTRNWLPGRKVIVSPLWIENVSWSDSTVAVDLPRETIEKAPKYDPTQAVNRPYEERLYDYYGRPRYWV